MFPDLPLLRSHLYAPGNNARLLERVFTTHADAVVLDLEDSVPTTQKSSARDMVVRAIDVHADQPQLSVFARINHPASGLAEDDINAVIRPGLNGVRIPKVENAETVRLVAGWIEEREHEVGIPAGSIAILCLIESAVGVYHALDIAASHPRVLGLAYGAADLTRDLRIMASSSGLETLYVRSHLVFASRLAGVRPPVDTVWTQIDDIDGLERATAQGRALGFFGKSAIHPAQLDVINAAYTPTTDEIQRARAIIEQAERSDRGGSGASHLDGEFIDRAVTRQALDILRLAELLGFMSSESR